MVYKVLVLVFIATVCVSPVLSSYETYLKVGRQCRNMQSWKNSKIPHMEQIEYFAELLQSDIQNLNVTIQGAVKKTERQAKSLLAMGENLMSRLTELEANFTYPEDYVPPPVAFQANVASSASSFMAITTSPIVFGNVKLNIGSHYSSTTGLFTVPITGMYWFYGNFHATSTDTKPLAVMKRIRNGSSKLIGHLRLYSSFATSCTTLIHLNAGDTVGVYPQSSTYEYWDISSSYDTSFAGYLVAVPAEEEEVAATTTTEATTTTTTTASTSASTTASTTTSGSG